MQKAEIDQDEEKPLDPEMEKVRRKMVRLLVVSIGIMILGVMAVLAGVVYKVVLPDSQTPAGVADTLAVPSEAPLSLAARLPAGFSVEDVALDGSRVLFYGRSADGTGAAIILDVSTGRIIAEIALK